MPTLAPIAPSQRGGGLGVPPPLCIAAVPGWYKHGIMDDDLLKRLQLPRMEPGWVWLVGAGPGDPGLITALGLQALADADYVLYDALVDEQLLALSRAEKIYAGKR